MTPFSLLNSQTEQKKFLMCHKQRMESYNKAASTVKKMRKKSKKSNASAQTLDKEIKVSPIAILIYNLLAN